MERWVGHLQFILATKSDGTPTTTAHIVYDVLTLAGLALAVRQEADPLQGASGVIVLRPAM
eukprot:5474694-Alexandrium_andersonii.AAC.1